jgi:long-chain acyl-CoA synthetase
MNLALWLDRAGRGDPHRPALGIGARVLRTYSEAASRVARLAGALRGFGLGPGDRVAIIAKNSPDYVEVLYAIWHAGLAAVPANAKLHGAELGYILEQSGARVCFVSDGVHGEIAAHAPQSLERLIVIGSAAYDKLFATDAVDVVPRGGDDLAWLFYTSGTTGRPKGAMLTHRVLAAASHAYLSEVDPVAPGDPIVHAAPMSHGSGLYIMPHVMRRGVNVAPESGGFEPDEIFRLFGAWPRASMFAAPTMVKRLVESPAECPSQNIRTVVWGGRRCISRMRGRRSTASGPGSRRFTVSANVR